MVSGLDLSLLPTINNADQHLAPHKTWTVNKAIPKFLSYKAPFKHEGRRD